MIIDPNETTAEDVTAELNRRMQEVNNANGYQMVVEAISEVNSLLHALWRFGRLRVTDPPETKEGRP